MRSSGFVPCLSLRLIFVAIAVLVTTLLPASLSAQTNPSEFAEMIGRERRVVESTRRDIREYISKQPERMARISERTQQLNQEVFRLFITYNLEENNPIEMRDMLRQITMVRDQAVSLIAPVKEEIESIQGLKKVIRTHVNDYERLASDNSITGVHRSATQYVAELKEAVGLLESAETVVEIIPNAAEQLIARHWG